jgi:hypothetical protein
MEIALAYFRKVDKKWILDQGNDVVWTRFIWLDVSKRILSEVKLSL